MNSSIDEALSPTDQQALDHLQSAVGQLTPAGHRKLLSLLASKCLPAEGGSVTLADEAGDVFACLYSTKRRAYDFTGAFTDEEVAEIKRNLFDPKKSRPWREVLAQLEGEDDRE